MTTTAPDRDPGSSVLPVILNRWSPRSFVPAEISKAELLSILDAGRWAPSAYNRQPWRFLYARRGTPDWDRFLSWLIPFNQGWAGNASAIVYLASRTRTAAVGGGESTPIPTHAFDTGAAAVLIEIQARQAGWASHPISGFDPDAARTGLGLPEAVHLNAAIVIGRQGEAGALPEGLREREKPSDREKLENLAFEGGFPPA